MIIKLNKIHSQQYLNYVVLDDKDEVIYTVNLPQRSLNQLLKETMTISKTNNELAYNIELNTIHRRDSWGCRIFDSQNRQIGVTHHRNRMANFFIGFSFFDFKYENRFFECFRADIDGIKLMIYEVSTKQQVGLAEMPSVVRNRLNEWTIYAKNQEDCLISLFCTLQLDYNRFDFRGSNRRNDTMMYKNFTPKVLREKYQASFKDE